MLLPILYINLSVFGEGNEVIQQDLATKCNTLEYHPDYMTVTVEYFTDVTAPSLHFSLTRKVE